jgi:uncharacterized membrane protein
VVLLTIESERPAPDPRHRIRRALIARPELVAVIACVATLLASFALKSGPEGGRLHLLCYSDIKTFFVWRDIGEMDFPYVHGGFQNGSLTGSSIEYPVLMGTFMWISARGASTAQQYLSVSAALLGIVALGIAWALGRLSGWRALMWALAPGLGLYAFHNWDLLAVGAMVTGVWFWHRGRERGAAVWFGIGCAFKLFPILLVPPLALDVAKRRGHASGIRVLLLGAVVAVAINLPFAVANPAGWAATYRFHIERPPNIDSIWGLATASWSPERVGTVSTLLTAVTFAGVLAYAVRRARGEAAFPFLGASGALVAAFMLWNKVHSPQYVLWILPFLVLLDVRIWWWLAYGVVDLTLYLSLFWVAAISLDEARPWLWLTVFGRALVLAGLVVAFARAAPASRTLVSSFDPSEPTLASTRA